MSALLRILAIGRAHRWRLALAVLAGVGAAGAAIGLTATSAWLISRASEQPPVLVLMVAIVAVRAFGIGRGALRYAERLAAHDAAFRILADLRVRVYQRLERLGPAGLFELRSGDLLVRLVGDVDGLADLWLRVLLPGLVVLLAAGGAVLLIAWLAPPIALVLLFTLLLAAVGAPMAAAALARRAERAITPLGGELADAALELLRGAPELVVAGAASARLADVRGVGERLRAAEARSALGAGTATLIASLAGGLAVWLALVLGVGLVRDGALAGVSLAVVVLTPIAVHELVAGLGPAAQQLSRQATAAHRVLEVLDRPVPVAAPETARPLPEGPLRLRVRCLSAGYPGGTEVLHGIDLDLPAGEWLLVTGPSGSGKSTLANVLVRFLEPSAGSVELIGPRASVSLADLDEDDARSVIGLAPQEVHLFDTSIEQNLRLARPSATPADVELAARSAGLAPWLDSLPQGQATAVGEHGAQVSGGQRQRIGLARAALAGWPITIYDEPTEHLDAPTADRLTADLLALARGRTTIFVTHRPELIAALGPGVRRLTLA